MIDKTEKYLDFSDVLIKAQYTDKVDSRSKVDLTLKINSSKEVFKDWRPVPVMSANMDTITDIEMAWALLERNWIPVLHKYVSIKEISALFDRIDKHNKENTNKIDYRNLFISRGTSNADKIKLKERLEAEPRIKSFCIDIANGHRAAVVDYLTQLKKDYPDKILMAGNVGSEDMVEPYAKAGVDIIKAGIGPGCFVAGQKVITKEGLMNIEDIKEGMEVLTHKNKYQKVLGTTSYKEKDSIISINGIESTLNHKYYVINKEDRDQISEDNLEKFAFWIEAINLNKKKHLLVRL